MNTFSITQKRDYMNYFIRKLLILAMTALSLKGLIIECMDQTQYSAGKKVSIKQDLYELLLEGYTEALRAATLSSDYKTILTLSEDGVVQLWEISTGKLLQIIKVPKGILAALSPDGTTILA